MAKQTEHDATDSDAPLSAAVAQRDLQKQVAEDQDWDHAAVVAKTFTIGKPAQELYDFWRDFNNLPKFMENIKEIRVSDAKTSHWVVAAPAGKDVEWDSEITEDEPGKLIAWRSKDGADINNTGRIEFLPAPGDRGTYVRLTMAYEPPGGDIGRIIAKLFQKEPQIQSRRDLRRFKQLIETGEIADSAAGPAAPRS